MQATKFQTRPAQGQSWLDACQVTREYARPSNTTITGEDSQGSHEKPLVE